MNIELFEHILHNWLRQHVVTNKISWRDLQKRMKQGDVFFSTGDFYGSDITNIVCNSYYSHTFIATDNKNIFNCYQAKNCGIMDTNDCDIYPLKKMLENGFIKKMFYLPISDRFKKKINFNKYIGIAPFGFKSALNLLIPPIFGPYPKYDIKSMTICSEIIAVIIKDNIIPTISYPSRLTPKLLCHELVDNGEYYQYLYEVDVSEFYNKIPLMQKIKNYVGYYDPIYMKCA